MVKSEETKGTENIYITLIWPLQPANTSIFSFRRNFKLFIESHGMGSVAFSQDLAFGDQQQ